jgi:hypothetical protein
MHTVLDPDQLFGLAGQIATYGWLILIFLPRTKVFLCIPQFLIPITIGLLYAGLMFVHYSNSDGNFGSLDSVRSLFENDYVLLAGWVHYLAFDLFVGASIAEESDVIGISRLVQTPILMATFMFGPIGLVIFLFVRSIFVPTFSTDKKDEVYVSQSI